MSDPRFLQAGFDKQLAHVVEECGEVTAAAGKTQRWGADSFNPDLPPAERETNAAWLWRELTDAEEAIARLKRTMVFDKMVSPPETWRGDLGAALALANNLWSQFYDQRPPGDPKNTYRALKHAICRLGAQQPLQSHDNGTDRERIATAYYDGFCDGIMRRPWEAAADYAAVMGQAYAKNGTRPQPFIPVTGPGPDQWHELRRAILGAKRLLRVEWRALLTSAWWMDHIPPLQWFGRRAALKRRANAIVSAELKLDDAVDLANDIDRATRGASPPASGGPVPPGFYIVSEAPQDQAEGLAR